MTDENWRRIWQLSERLDETSDIAYDLFESGKLNGPNVLKIKAIIEAIAIGIKHELKGDKYSLLNYPGIAEFLQKGEIEWITS